MRNVKLLLTTQRFKFAGIAFLSWICSSSIAGQKLVTTSPAVTELLFQLGYGDQIVAASEFSDYPEQAKLLPRIGSLFSPSIEQIVRLSPDWVILDDETSPAYLSAQLDSLKLQKHCISIKSVSDLFNESERLIQRVFKQTNLSQIALRRDQFRRTQLALKKPFSFLAVAWTRPLTLIGTPTFLSDLLVQMGGKNLIGEAIQISYPQVGEEWMIKHHPEVVFLLTEDPNAEKEFQSLAKKYWPERATQWVLLPNQLFARTSFTALDKLPQFFEAHR
jgi:ABC-type hemin transport system substrate-binding protein